MIIKFLTLYLSHFNHDSSYFPSSNGPFCCVRQYSIHSTKYHCQMSTHSIQCVEINIDLMKVDVISIKYIVAGHFNFRLFYLNAHYICFGSTVLRWTTAANCKHNDFERNFNETNALLFLLNFCCLEWNITFIEN